jgi:tetratricopeptide (TPR) repeat protein
MTRAAKIVWIALAFVSLMPAIAIADRGDDFPVARPSFELPATSQVQAQQCAHGSGDLAISACDWVIASGHWPESDLAWAYWDRGLAEYDTKQYDKAVADFTYRLKVKPDDAKALVMRGVTYRTMHKFQSALDDFNAAMKLKSDDAVIYLQRGYVEDLMKQPLLTMADFDKAVAVEPANSLARAVRGAKYYEDQNYPSALTDFNTAINLGDESAVIYKFRGNTYRELKQYANAVPDFDHALKLRPDYSSAFFGRGLANISLHRYADAVADFDQAIRLGPEQSAAYNNRCWARAVWGRQYDLALADCVKALAIRPHLNPFASRSLVYLRLGKFSEAISDCNEALKFDPKDADVLFIRGVAKRKSNDAPGGDADIAAAKASDSGIVDRYSDYGVTQ